MDDRLYLDTPFEEKEKAKRLGARWDKDAGQWWVPPGKNWRDFISWLPVRDKPRRPLPTTLTGKLSHYYLSLLSQANVDDTGNNKLCLEGLNFDDLEAGRVGGDENEFDAFWKKAKALHDACPFPLGDDTSSAGKDPGGPPTAGVFVAIGIRNTGAGDKYGVISLVPALLQKDGCLLSVHGVPVAFNDAYFDPQPQPRLPVLGTTAELAQIIESTEWSSAESWNDTWSAVSDVFLRLPGFQSSMRAFRTKPRGRPLALWLVPYESKDGMVKHLRALYARLVDAAPQEVPLFASLCDSGPPSSPLSAAERRRQTRRLIKSFASIADEYGVVTVAARWLSPVQSYGWYYPSRSAAKNDEYSSYQLLIRGQDNAWEYGGATQGLNDQLENDDATRALSGEYLHAFRSNFPSHANVSRVQDACDALLDHLRTLATGRGAHYDSATVPLPLPAAIGLLERLSSLVTEAGLASRRKAQQRVARKARRDARIVRLTAECSRSAGELRSHIASIVELAVPLRGMGLSLVYRGWLGTLVAWVRAILLRKKRSALINQLAADIGLSGLPRSDAALLQAADQLLSKWRRQLSRAEQRQGQLDKRAAQLAALDAKWFPAAQALASAAGELESLVRQLQNLAFVYLPADRARAWAGGIEDGLGGGIPGGVFDAMQGAILGAAIANGGGDAADTASEMLEQMLDRTIRRRCFDLAARYWEGRWLVETDRARRQPEDWKAGLRRQCMLAPVIVGTVYTLPSLFRDETSQYRLSSANLLIVDEAGQADPAVSLGLFALAQQAVVVGDVHQLKPIWKVRDAQDLNLLQRANLHEAASMLAQRGLRASSGSAMKAAQSASAYSDTDGRGITLIRHYRCRPTIIEFCNRLVYDSLRPLIPMTKEDMGRMFHPMSYVECTGSASRDGSVANNKEADELIDWLIESRSQIERYYNIQGSRSLAPGDQGYRDIGDLVGIVAPFSAQCRDLEKKLRERLGADGMSGDSDVVTRMKLGTVHKLQGAERPIVLFSATNTPDDGGSPFIDGNADMLNVAISRAQDTFVLFGHPGLFFEKHKQRPSNHDPSAVLGRYMKRHGQRLYPRRLVVVESPNKVSSLQAALGRSCRVVATEGHFREIEKVDLTTLQVHWRIVNEKHAIISRISEWLEDIDEIVIATDDDREGDAIGWHLLEELRERCPIDGLTISRMAFHEVTEVAIKTGFDQRIAWTHTQRARAAVARAIIDKVIGQVMSDVIRDRMRVRGMEPRVGVGRVRAALLQIIAEWERAAEATKLEWSVSADATADDDARVTFWVTESGAPESPIKRFHERADAEQAADTLRASGRPHLAIERKTFTLGPAPGVGTAEILIAAYEQFGFRPIDTQKLLQELYEGNRAAVAGAIRAKNNG